MHELFILIYPKKTPKLFLFIQNTKIMKSLYDTKYLFQDISLP